MRRTRMLLAALLAATLMLCFAAPALATAFHTDIRVLLSVGKPSSIEIRPTGDYYVRENPDFELEDKMTVTRVGGRPVLTSGGKTLSAASITLVSRDYEGLSSYIRLRNSRYGTSAYLGNMTFDVSEGALRAINTLPIERYLYGVVPYEMSNTFPLEALKAQAVCARGYAIANCSSYGSRSYDILDTSADQVYHGYVSKYTRAIQAVDETRGQVLTFGGDIITAYYSASNGGQTERTGNVWRSDLPYYIQQDDEYDTANPSSLEERSFIPAAFTDETMALMDEAVLLMLSEGATAAAGEPVTLVSTVRLKGHSAKYDPPSRSYTKADAVLTVKTGMGREGQVKVTVDLDALVHSDENPEGIFNAGERSLRMRGAERGTLTAGDEEYEGWFLINRRWGHGVGLSQRGAQQRATGGHEYGDILGFYYAETALATVADFKTAPAPRSESYTVAAEGITGVSPETSVKKLLSRLKPEADTELVLLTPKGNEKTGSTAGTGDVLRTIYGGGSSFLDLSVIIYGDVDGDGEISRDDLSALKLHLLGDTRLSGARLAAADIDHSGAVDSLDALRLRKCLHDDYDISQNTGGND